MVDSPHFQNPVVDYARTDFPLLREDMTAEGALALIREHGIGERIIYFYVTDGDDRLTGVLPTRRLLTAALDARLGDIMVRRVVTIPKTATLLDACDLFVMHKFFALPVVDEKRRVIGTVDLSVFTQEMLDLSEPDKTDDVFEALGFRLSELRDASPFRAFRVRFPWLLATIASGTYYLTSRTYYPSATCTLSSGKTTLVVTASSSTSGTMQVAGSSGSFVVTESVAYTTSGTSWTLQLTCVTPPLIPLGALKTSSYTANPMTITDYLVDSGCGPYLDVYTKQ